MQIEWREGGRRGSQSLKHSDFEKAKQQADEFAANYVEPQPEAEAEPEPLTLGQLFEMYQEEVTPTKSKGVQKFDKAAARRIKSCLGADVIPDRLSRMEWDRFIHWRSSGGAGPRTVARDLKFLLAVLNWATLAGSGDGALLERNALRGLPIPSEKNPRRPSITVGEYKKLLGVADDVDPMVRTLLVLAHETGHRIGAVRQLRWSDVDLEHSLIRWRADCDKIGNEHSTPLTDTAHEALEAHRRQQPGIGDAFVFPSPKDPSKPISRHLVRDWWRSVEEAAGLERIEGRGWHSFRRKLASDLMDEPLKVLADLGGWKSTQTVVECYQRPSETRMRAALKRRRSG